jgi:hypothetical protein
MSKDRILADLPRMKEDLNFALQRMLPICTMIEEDLRPFQSEITARFQEVGRGVRRVRAAHVGDNQTPIVYVEPEGDGPFGESPEEKAVLEWLDKEIKERVGVGAKIEPGRGVPAAAKG